jgi:hypothetical protein
MSQNHEAVIDKYIRDNYLSPKATVSFLCLHPAESTFLDIFTDGNPGLPFLTEDNLRGLSHDNYLTNGDNLQLTLDFIKMKLREYYNFIYDIWICFKFAIIIQIPDGTTDPGIIQKTINDYLPAQLINLLYYLFDIFYNILTLTFPPDTDDDDITVTKRGMIQKNVVYFVLLYSRLYIFLQQPDPSFTFNNKNLSLVFLSYVMVYKCFDSLHKISSIIIENYIACLQRVFNRYIFIFGTTDENKEKIDFALGHLACYFLYLPNHSLILSNSEVSRQIEAEFEKKEILFRRGSDGKIENLFTLEAVEALKRSGKDISRFDVRRNLDFNPMHEGTLSNAVGFVSDVIKKLNEKQRSSITEAVVNSIIEKIKTKYVKYKGNYDYFNFIYILSAELEEFISKNSTSKDRLILKSDCSQCCTQIPEFAIYTMEEYKRMKILEERKQVQQQKEIQRMKEEEQRNVERMQQLDEMKFRKQQKEKEERRKKMLEHQQDAAAATSAIVSVVPKQLTDKDKQAFIVQRNNSFKKNIEPIFKLFSNAIESKEYETAASMLNEKLPLKLRAVVPWTVANMQKFSLKMADAYNDLLGPVASSAVAPPSMSPVVVASSSKSKKKPSKQAELEQAQLESQKVELESQKVKLEPQQVKLEPREEQPQPQLMEKKSPKLIQFESDIASLCKENTGHACFAFMFHCSLKQFFRITTVVRELPDQAILQIMSSLVPVSDSASRAPPLINYMNLQGSGQRIRALFVLALLNGLCRREHLRFAFTGRTFLQLLACHSSLPEHKCQEMHIPKDTSDFDVHVIFNNDIDPMQYRLFTISIFNLFWNYSKDFFHIHIDQRDDRSWMQFQLLSGHIYESGSRGFPDTVKISLNTKGKQESIVEVSDISFKKVEEFTDIFIFTGESKPQNFRDIVPPLVPQFPPPLVLPQHAEFFEKSSAPQLQDIDSPTVSPKTHVPHSSVATLKLLNLTYNLDEILFFTNQRDACNVQLKFEFPDEQSGLVESLRIVIKILNSFVTNQFEFESKKDFYFIHISNLLKFLVRALQIKGIILFQDLKEMTTIHLLYQSIIHDFHEELKSNQSIDPKVKPTISLVGIKLFELFFNPEKTIFFDQAFKATDAYRKTTQNNEGANIRITMPLHHIILKILKENGFDDSYLSSSQIKNLYGGYKYSYKNNNNKYTRKNKKQKMKKRTVGKKNKKIKKIKLSKKKDPFHVLKNIKKNTCKVIKK